MRVIAPAAGLTRSILSQSARTLPGQVHAVDQLQHFNMAAC